MILFILALQFIGIFPKPEVQPVRFEVSADWHLSDEERTWLEDVALPSRLQEARQLVEFATGAAHTLDGVTIEVQLRPDIWYQDGWVAGSMRWPVQRRVKIEIAWNEEIRTGLILSHELGHAVAFHSTTDNSWWHFGHGNVYDPFLKRIQGLISRAYLPGHEYNPFRFGINAALPGCAVTLD